MKAKKMVSFFLAMVLVMGLFQNTFVLAEESEQIDISVQTEVEKPENGLLPGTEENDIVTEEMEVFSDEEPVKVVEYAEKTVPNGTNQDIYLDNYYGNDTNDGLTADTAVKTFSKAKELVAENGIIWLQGSYKISEDETWSLSGKGSAMVKRNRVKKDSHGNSTIIVNNMIEIQPGATLTLDHITIDGAKELWESGQAHNDSIVAGLDGGRLILNEGAILQNNNASYMGAGVSGWNGFELVMNDGSAIRNNDCHGHEYGGGVFITKGTFTMNGGSVSGNRANRGGGVAIIAGTFTMNGGTVDGNATYQTGPQPGYGGGIYIADYEGFSGAPATYSSGPATFTMKGGFIQNNNAQSVGGGILTFPQDGHKVTLNISGGTIENNTTASNGGGICMYYRDTVLNMTGGKVLNNTAKYYGGGLYQYNAIDITVNGGEIRNNTAASSGGGAYLEYGSRLMLYGGEFTQNTANFGGGVDIQKNSLFYMNGGTVKENTANIYGGGVDINSGRFCMIDGTIQENKAQHNGSSAGVYVQDVFELGGTAKINPDNDVYLLSNKGKHIDMISNYTGTTGKEPIQITSNTKFVEEDSIGTKLVYYKEKAGGAENAKKADQDGIFAPSAYMDEGLMIGQSAFEKDYMTYVPTVTVNYAWVGNEAPSDTEVPTPDRCRKNLPYYAKEQHMTNEPYWFNGWYTDQECTKKFVDETKLNESITLYGEWKKYSPAQVAVFGKKLLDGKVPNGSQFSFKLLDAEGKTIQTQSAVDGKITFEPIQFDTIGTYHYQVVEIPGADDATKYDNIVYDVLVTVTMNEMTHALAADMKISTDGKSVDEILFQNNTIKHTVNYEFVSKDSNLVLPQKVMAQLPTAQVVKQGSTVTISPNLDLINVKTSDGIWQFVGWDKTEVSHITQDETFVGTWNFVKNAYPMNIVPVIHATDKELTVGDSFDELYDVTATDKEDGDLTNKIVVVESNVDTSKVGVYEVTYKVIDKDGASVIKTIRVTVKDKDIISGSDTPNAPTKPNTPNKPENPVVPSTGYNSNLMMWTLLLAVSIGGLGIVYFYKKKSKNR